MNLLITENIRDHLSDFVRLNEEWISHYFKIEAVDRELAADPGQVIDNGGYIFSLQYDEAVVGVCALFREDGGVFELARMAVSPEHQSKGYGDALMQTCLTKLTQLNAKKVYLVSNTKLTSAISLYKKYGFETTMLGEHPIYSRANIIMERNFFQTEHI